MNRYQYYIKVKESRGNIMIQFFKSLKHFVNIDRHKMLENQSLIKIALKSIEDLFSMNNQIIKQNQELIDTTTVEYGNINSKLENFTKLIEEQNNFIISENEKINTKIENIRKLIEQQNKNLNDIKNREIETIKGLIIKNTIPSLENKITLHTEFPIAYESPDHIAPLGTKNDNSIYIPFNLKLYQLMIRKFSKNKIAVLDLGCSGGGFVQSILEDGHFAIGLEGSDYSKNIKRAAWRIIPNNLFTCDISKDFNILNSIESNFKFDVITAWELMEHFKEKDLTTVLDNIRRHLSMEGFFICSICTVEDIDPVSGLHWHQTVKEKTWWENLFFRHGFEIIEQDIIGNGDWLRGSGHFGEWDETWDAGFHLVLKLKNE
jgi:2-polyprenyl-3-methyl-5-hydroxy-6-metoxy-1,4-benzoquinol methylase